MTNIPRISDAEWEVMKVLWSNSPLTANEVIDTLEGRTTWNLKTIRTLIRRLVEKKALGVDQEGRYYSYYPLVSEDICIRTETKSFMKRLYGGAMQPFLVNFLREGDLSSEDVEELKKILDEKTK